MERHSRIESEENLVNQGKVSINKRGDSRGYCEHLEHNYARRSHDWPAKFPTLIVLTVLTTLAVFTDYAWDKDNPVKSGRQESSNS